MSATPPNKLVVSGPDNATPAPIPAELVQRIDDLPITDPDTFWLVARLVEYANRLGYADGHARGYRDRDREFVTEHRGATTDTQAVRSIQPKAQ